MTLTKKPETRPATSPWGLSAGADVPWEYDPAPEATDHIRIEPEYGLFIGNEFRPSKPRKTFTVINPATEEPLAKVAHASKADVNRAVGVAHEAHRSVWSKLPGRDEAADSPRADLQHVRDFDRRQQALHSAPLCLIRGHRWPLRCVACRLGVLFLIVGGLGCSELVRP